jgi:hypothetical protein
MLAAAARANDVTVDFHCVASASPTPTPRTTPSATPSTADRECTPASNQAIDDKWTIAFTAKAGSFGKLRRVKLFILSEDPKIASPGQRLDGKVDPAKQWGDPGTEADWSSLAKAPNSAELRYDWFTDTLTPYNGKYTIRVEALSHSDADDDFSVATREHVKVNNPPETPKAPTSTLGTSAIEVRWAPAPEPDFVSYTLLRARLDSASDTPADDDFTVLEQNLESTKFTDAAPAPGTYFYRVRSLRHSVVSKNGAIASADSSSSKAVTVVPPPTPAASTPPPLVTLAPIKIATPAPAVVRKPPPVPDAPFSAILPYKLTPAPPEASEEPEEPLVEAEQPAQPAAPPQSRAAVLPVAIGAFLISAALSFGRPPG